MDCGRIVPGCLALCIIGSQGTGIARTSQGIEVVTAPSADITMSFV